MVKVRTPDSYSILDFTLGGINKTPIYLSIRITQYLMPVMYLMIIIELCNWIKKHSVHTWLQDIPRQLNGSDCGVFVCRYAECISQGTNMEFTQVGRLIPIKFLNVKWTWYSLVGWEERNTLFRIFEFCLDHSKDTAEWAPDVNHDIDVCGWTKQKSNILYFGQIPVSCYFWSLSALWSVIVDNFCYRLIWDSTGRTWLEELFSLLAKGRK